MFILETPRSMHAEREYAARAILGVFMGQDFELLRTQEDGSVRLSVAGHVGSIVFPDLFFPLADDHWLLPSSFPDSLFTEDRFGGAEAGIFSQFEGLPLIFAGVPRAEESGASVFFPVDIFGLAFFMLTRYEEAASDSRDSFGRFPGICSMAYRFGFLDRPLIDQYVGILWEQISALWPGVNRVRRQFQIGVSCDLDSPYEYGADSLFVAGRRVLGDILIRKSLSAAKSTLRRTIAWHRKDYSLDRYMASTQWIMAVNEECGNKVQFFAITGPTSDPRDGVASIESAPVRCVLRSIRARDHAIGMHGTIGTASDEILMKREYSRFRKALESEGWCQGAVGSRQHYLMWDPLRTAAFLSRCGFHFDSSLGYPDLPGFRCGTCMEFPLFDLVDRKPLELLERPLIVMERTVLDDAYLGLGLDEAVGYMLELKEACRRVSGNFNVLWHNSSLITDSQRSIYRELIS